MGDLHRRLIAFDLDGTLVDSRQDLATAANALLADLGAPALATEAVAAMVGEGAGVLVGRVLAAAGLPPDPAALPAFLAHYDRHLLDTTTLYDGVGELLSAAAEVGTVAVLTNKPLVPTERILAALGVRSLIAHVIGGDGPFPRKPDPSGLRALMDASNVSATSTLLVGDSAIDLETARQAGAACCLVSYGFGRPETLRPPREWQADDARAAREIVVRFGA